MLISYKTPLKYIVYRGISRYSVSKPNPVATRIFGLIGSGSGILLLHPALDPDPLLH